MIPLYGRKWRRIKEPLEGERGEWKSWLKLNIQKTKVMASSALTSRQIEGEKVEAVTDFIFSGFKITVDSDCSHEILRHLLLGRKAMTNPDSVLKSRDSSLLTTVGIVKALIFPVVMYWCEVGTQTRLSTKEFMLLNCGAGKDSWESLRQQGNQTSQS